MTTTAPARDVLTQAEAEARAADVNGVSYELSLDLRRGAETYRGEVTIRFRFDGGSDTFLDFRGKQIERFEVNGGQLDPALLWTGYRLTIPADALARDNVVRVVYENEYDHTGDGLHQFIDPEDGEEYLYSNFEPYESHRLFPNFDQPDLKATYALTVVAPANWEVINNGRPRHQEETSDGRRRWVFETTRPFSTYLFALIAGPYSAVRDEHRGIPLGLFCRRSLVPYLDTEELFTVTKQGLDFYEEFFDTPYPFVKYDQVFVPEFNAGAMENVGAITHSERMVFRDPPTDRQRESRAEVVLHEMAHMWFGDLVTMRWWNDLWLNESFATYMSYLTLTEATRFRGAWQDFNSGMKSWAYRQDQLVTTHPIAGQVPDTEHTFLNFDGITYGKGASVIKQLVAAMGMDGFREGMRIYFRRHAFQNTTLSQWLDALGEGVGRDLHEWARLWLETPSLNTVAARVEPADRKIGRLTVTQMAPEEYPTIRPHRLDVALVRNDGDVARIDEVPVHLDGGEVEVAEAAGRALPDFVFPNHNDHGFVKVALDARSLEYAQQHLDRIEDSLLRQLIWQALWNMVRDQQLKSTEYLRLIAAQIGSEPSHELIETILANAQGTIARFVPDDQRLAEAHRFFQLAWDQLHSVPQGDLQIMWGRALIGMAINAEDIVQFARLADGEVSVPGFTVDQEMRWELAARFVAYGLEGAGARVAAERERDPSDRGQRALLRCETSEPDAETKAEAWRRFHDEGYGSLHLTSAAMSGFQWYVQRELTRPYEERFFEEVPAVFEARPHEAASAYFGGLFPGRVDQAILDRSERLLAEVGERLPTLARSLREANDDLARAIRCRAFAAS
ncbi:MAG: aminopeptidase N [Dehalococcoidia bacterium]